MKPLYKTYAFKNKDPVIDLLRTALQFEADAQGIKFSAVMKQVALSSGVNPSTLYNWFFGATISPRYCCVAAVANSVRVLIYIGGNKAAMANRRPQLRLVG